MAKDNSPTPNNVLPLGNTTCCVEKCTKKNHKMNFCAEHFVWFKEGLISKKGEKPSDFDKKFQAFTARTKKAA